MNLPVEFNPLEFSPQAFSKMIMHTMKHPHAVCSGLLLSPKPTNKDGTEQQGDCNDTISSPILSSSSSPSSTLRVIEAIPIAHNSNYLVPNIEIALNAVSNYAQEQDLVISGYYQSDKSLFHLDVFGQRVSEKIVEFYPEAVLCFISFNESVARTHLTVHHLIDGKWHSRSPESFKVDIDTEILSDKVLFSKEKLYRKIVDFDDHLDNIAQDWTNRGITQRIDYLVTKTCSLIS